MNAQTSQAAVESNRIDPAFIQPEKLKEFLDKGGVISELLDINAEELNSIYSMAFNFYESDRLEEAESLFQLLCTYDHYNVEYYLGLGGCRQAKGRYKEAADTYSIAVLFDVNEPRLPFHAAECHLALRDLESAESGFYAAAMRSGSKPEYAELKVKAEGLHKLVLKQKEQAESELTKTEEGESNV